MGSEAEFAMTSGENRRIDDAEKAIVGLSGRMDGVETRLGHVEKAVGEGNEGIQRLLNRQGGYEATRDMIPVKHIWAALALFASLIGVGLTMLMLYTNNITKEIVEDRKDITAVNAKVDTQVELLDTRLQREMRNLDALQIGRLDQLDRYLQLEFKSADEHTGAQLDALRTEFELRLKRVEDDVVENSASLASRDGVRFNMADHIDFRDTYFLPLEERVREIENSRATDGDFSKLVDRVARLEVSVAENNAMVQKAWDEIVDHEDELDHPIRQTFEGERRDALLEQALRRIEQIESDQKQEGHSIKTLPNLE